jgi:Zn finger protein HypA/HybF involved in hydrogenase expression
MVNTGAGGIKLDVSTVNTDSPTVCPACDSTLSYPVDWQQLTGVLWLTWLRCPNCESIAPRVLDDGEVRVLDVALDRGTYALLRELERMAREESGAQARKR